MATWYVVDTRTNEIINAIEASHVPERALAGFVGAEHLRLDADPPRELLERYRYFWERP